MLSVSDIMEYHKNRYPWFFVDRISFVSDGIVEGIKLFSANEFYAKGSSKGSFVPSFIVGEALEQTALMTFMEKKSEMLTNTISSDMEYFRELVYGDVLCIRAELQYFRRGVAKVFVSGSVDGDIIGKGIFVIAVPEVMNMFLPKSN